MAEAVGAAEPASFHRGLPDEIAVWEILVRLPPKPLLRCRAVCRAWRHATSTRDFLLAHHGRQPPLPLLYTCVSGDSVYLDVIPFDHRVAVDQLQSVARLGHSDFSLKTSCDGLLVLCGRYRNLGFFICNLATRQYARLYQIDGFALWGMYPHSPTGEYRLLLGKSSYSPEYQDGSYIFTLGSGRPPRRIRCLDAEDDMVYESSVLFHGNLHWHVEQHQRASSNSMITVFNTTTESFRLMRAPAVGGKGNLFEMDRMLGMSSFNDAVATIDIWMMQDYESEEWAFVYRVQLPVADLTVQFGKFHSRWSVVSSWDGGVLVLVKFGQWLLQMDMDGKLVTSFNRIFLGYATEIRCLAGT